MGTHGIGEIRTGTVHANGIRFAYLEAGEGPLLLLLHGFPDNALTWSQQIPRLVKAGYRVVAPFLRGFPPTEIPGESAYTIRGHAEDVCALIDALGGRPARIVGHDWGASATFAAIAQSPERIERACVLAASHPATLLATFESPRLLHHLFHVWFFQLEEYAENSVRANDYALIEYLWRYWSGGTVDSEHLATVKRTLAADGALPPMLGYYRSLVRLPFDDPDFISRAFRPIPVPVLTIFGGNDPVRALAEGEERHFAGEYRREIVDGAGHVVHRDRPERVTDLLVEWFSPAARPSELPTASTQQEGR
ncbi:MAG: alpha/beta fold hydrolase [Candidatus Binatia bacterium]